MFAKAFEAEGPIRWASRDDFDDLGLLFSPEIDAAIEIKDRCKRGHWARIAREIDVAPDAHLC